MKIEKISDNQIRCTLSKEDLISRQLRLSELAYGTEKAKNLFRDMMQQASFEFGFEADDIPLMIEAIPVSGDCLVLVITKVENPEELDTRFSKFSAFHDEDAGNSDFEEIEDHNTAYADDIIDSFEQMDDNTEQNEEEEAAPSFIPLSNALGIKNEKAKPAKPQAPKRQIIKVFSFDSLENVVTLAGTLSSYPSRTSLYKNPSNSKYYLAAFKSEQNSEDYNRICSIFSEYGKQERITYASISYFDEHFKLILENDALQTLSAL